MARQEESEKSLLGMVGGVVSAIVNSPEIQAHARLGFKELGNALDMSRDGSVSQPSHEYGMPASMTPGEIAKDREDGVQGAHDGKFNVLESMFGSKDEKAQEAVKEVSKEVERDAGRDM